MEAMPSNLHLWGSLPTQTAIQEVKKIDFYPVNSIDSSDTIDFVIPKIPKLMLDRVEVLAKIRVVQAGGTNPAANNDVSTVSDLSGALWRNVDVSIGGVSITQSFDNSYTMTHFWDTVLHNKIANEHLLFQKEGVLLDYVTNKAQSEDLTFYPEASGGTTPPPANKNGRLRADRIAQGKTVSIISDLDVSLFKQEKLLPSNLAINVSLTKNYDGFILLSATAKTEKVVIDKVILQCTFHRPTNVMLNILEERLSKEAATYHADKTVLTFQNIAIGDHQGLTFDNLFTGELPYFFIVGVQDRAAYGKAKNKNPFTYHRFNKIALFLDGVEHFPKPVEFKEDEHGIMYHNFLESIGYINGGDTLIDGYYKPHQVMGFDLTQDNSQNQSHLNLKKSGSVRLKLDLNEEAAENLVLMVLAYYERIIQITKDREVIII